MTNKTTIELPFKVDNVDFGAVRLVQNPANTTCRVEFAVCCGIECKDIKTAQQMYEKITGEKENCVIVKGEETCQRK